MRTCLFFIIPTLLIALSTRAMGQDTQVLASVTGNTIGLEETVTFTVEIRAETLSGVVAPSPPDTDGLSLAQRFPSTQQSMSIVNGKVSQSVGYSWTYRPAREGRDRNRLGPEPRFIASGVPRTREKSTKCGPFLCHRFESFRKSAINHSCHPSDKWKSAHTYLNYA